MEDADNTADTLELEPFDEEAASVILSPKREAFVQEYLIDMIATKAALRAGFSPSTGAQLIREPVIAAKIRIALAQRAQRTKVTQDWVLHEMSLLANSDLGWFVIDDHGQVALTDKAPVGAMKAVQSVKRKVKVVHARGDNEGYTEYEVEIKLWDKPGPLKLMGRHTGLFPDRMEHTGPNGGPIETVSRVERVIVDPAPKEV